MVLVGTGRRIERRALALLLSVFLAAGTLLAGRPDSARSVADLVSVIVRAADVRDARTAVESNGGTVSDELHLVDAVVAKVPADHLGAVRATPGVVEVTPNAPVHAQGITQAHDATDAFNQVTRATSLWNEGVDGTTSTVAVIDTGIQANLSDLAGRVIGGVDFTTEANPYKDSFGHGTFVAGIVAGNGAASNGQYKGMAPDARLVSVKIAGANGASDVAQLLKALEWVVSNKARYGIDVVNLSVGTDSTQPYALSPLDRAVEQAWQAGIVVVVSASNLGEKGHGTITKPADDPFVITVGAVDDKGSPGRGDDEMAGFSGMGPTAADGISKPEVVASGRSVVSLRTPGSFIDNRYPSGRVGSAYFKGSGTSFAAGVVSGAAALLLDREPNLNPNQVKARLMGTAVQVAGGGENISGSGSIDAYAASHSTSMAEANQNIPFSAGAGTVSADEGSLAVDVNTNLVTNLVTGLLGTLTSVLFQSSWTVDPTGSTWWGSTWWGSTWWGSTWWGSTWWGSTWWGDWE